MSRCSKRRAPKALPRSWVGNLSGVPLSPPFGRTAQEQDREEKTMSPYKSLVARAPDGVSIAVQD